MAAAVKKPVAAKPARVANQEWPAEAASPSQWMTAKTTATPIFNAKQLVGLAITARPVLLLS